MTSNCSKANIQETRDDEKEICFILGPTSEKTDGAIVPKDHLRELRFAKRLL
jgi:hypothetical protein